MAMATWRDIPGFGGMYQASDEGQIRSNLYHRSLNPAIDKRPGQPYRFVHLTKPQGGMAMRRVHILVALTFLGPAGGRWVEHIDGDLGNNRLDNLRYVPAGKMARKGPGR